MPPLRLGFTDALGELPEAVRHRLYVGHQASTSFTRLDRRVEPVGERDQVASKPAAAASELTPHVFTSGFTHRGQRG